MASADHREAVHRVPGEAPADVHRALMRGVFERRGHDARTEARTIARTRSRGWPGIAGRRPVPDRRSSTPIRRGRRRYCRSSASADPRTPLGDARDRPRARRLDERAGSARQADHRHRPRRSPTRADEAGLRPGRSRSAGFELHDPRARAGTSTAASPAHVTAARATCTSWSPDSPEAMRHRMLRDWLRDHADDRERYAAAKRVVGRRRRTPTAGR